MFQQRELHSESWKHADVLRDKEWTLQDKGMVGLRVNILMIINLSMNIGKMQVYNHFLLYFSTTDSSISEDIFDTGSKGAFHLVYSFMSMLTFYCEFAINAEIFSTVAYL
jgi:hypothetical protein